ncbi:protein kinase 2b chloroplastic, partial [Phtheirospermum japonicum]
IFLELLTGRRVIDKNRGPKEENLADWAELYLRIFQIMDRRLEGQDPDNKAYAVATIALQFLSAEPKLSCDSIIICLVSLNLFRL